MKKVYGFSASDPITAKTVSLLMVLFMLAGSMPAFSQTCPQDQTVTDFGQGTSLINTVVVPDYDGAVILAPASNEEFAGTSVPSGWVNGDAWTTGGTITYPGGSVIVNGSHIYSSAFYGPGTSIEFVATFTAGNFQNVGFSTGGAFNSPWVTIGRADQAGTGLYARSNLGTTELLLGDNLLNNPHLYKIVWNATNFQFYVDGVLLQTLPVEITSSMSLQISDYNYDTDGIVLSVDCMRATPYASPGTFTSRVFGGLNPKNWEVISWNADVPAETNLSMYVRTGDVPEPDRTWTAFVLVPVSGSTVGETSRYIQYQATLSTGNPLFTPELKDISINCTEITIIPPTVTSHPVSQSSCVGQTVVFESAAYGYPSPEVQWQVSTDGGTNWLPVAGAINSSLSVVVGSGDNGNRYRAVWTNSGGSAASEDAVLTIGITASIEVVSSQICEQGTVELRLNSATGKAPWSLVVNGSVYSATSTGIVFASFPNVSTSQDYNLTSVTDNDGCNTIGSPLSTAYVTILPLPGGSLTAVAPSVDQGEEISLVFNATSGTEPYTLVINGTSYPDVVNGTEFSAGNSDYTPLNIWGNTTGGEPGVVDADPLELGFKFRSSIAGLIRGIRFYKRIQQTGTHTGSLWASEGALLATGTFINETASGWQEMFFDQPVLIQQNVTYVASYFAPNGHYAFTPGYFTSSGYTNGSLTALQSGTDGLNGVYLEGPGFPTQSFNDANYWVDVIFDDGTSSSVSDFYLSSVVSAEGCTLTGNPISSASVTVNRSVWTGGAGVDWSNSNNWASAVVPDQKAVVIPVVASQNYPEITSNVIAADLTIWPSASLTVNAGEALTVNGALNTAGGTLTINSASTASSGSLIVNGTSTGNVTYNRFLRPEDTFGDRHFFSSPVGEQNVGAFIAANPGKIEPEGTEYAIREWNEESLTANWQIVSPLGSFESGRGYRVNQAVGSDGLLKFTGTVVNSATVTATSPYANYNNNPRNTAADYGDPAFSPDPSIWAPGRSWDNYGGGGWNLMGNPFTSAMNAATFISVNTGKFDPNYQALYLYDGDSATPQYLYAAAIDPGYEEGGFFSDNIQAGQGFFVLVLYNDLDFNFTPAMQVHNTGLTLLKSGKAESNPWPGLQLKVRYGDKERSTVIVYNSEMTTGRDPGYDVGQLSAGPDVEIYTSLVLKDNSVNFARQALPIAGADTIVVPVGIDSEKGGEVTFSAYTVPLGTYKFWLEDHITGIITNLNANTYKVTLPANTYGTGRFYLKSASTATAIETPSAEAGLRIWTSNNKVIIKGSVSQGATVAIFDLQGKKILETLLPDEALNTLTMPSGSHGVFLVRVVDGVKIYTQKVVLL